MVYIRHWSNLWPGVIFGEAQSVHEAGRYLAFVSHHFNAISVAATDSCHFVKVRVMEV
jgi:hypothetical protein